MLRLGRVEAADGSAHWLLFEDGRIATPLRVLSDFEVDSLLEQIEEQRGQEIDIPRGDDVALARRKRGK